LITGSTGWGKTCLGCALGAQACRYGFSVRYFRITHLIDELRVAHADDRSIFLFVSLGQPNGQFVGFEFC
jgi:DNA replication protein DnaC